MARQSAVKVREKCLFRIRRLAELGHDLRRPEADLLRDGIHELRVGFRGQNYHRARERKRNFETNSALHTHEGEY